MTSRDRTEALVIGGGPAGLMAADALLSAGHRVLLAEAKPSLGRKFLMAGKSGLNLTRMEEEAAFRAAYAEAAPQLAPMLEVFGPEDVRAWAEGLGQETFTGSSGRLFPKAMKASPLLRAWLERLTGMGLEVRTRWRWQGWEPDGALRFGTPEGPHLVCPRVTVLALGGASWARLGSDGAWAVAFGARGLPVTPFAPSNAGLSVNWSAHMERHFGAPLKNVTFRAGPLENRGEAVISARGLEGGGIYPLTPALRDGQGLMLDLVPDLDHATLGRRLAQPRGKQSRANALRKALRLPPAAQALLMECARPLPEDPAALASLVKALPVPGARLRPMDEAISTAGGVPFAALDGGLMLRDLPGTFCAGEMLDWEAPTGGYLLTACLATGLWAGRHAADWLNQKG
ncbi:TIGR03862 family flavoprotein [Maliponia aquimaris]|uniref:HI0933-like protein n=1 Tax=Maliponia aquimaris TaxID=1673631 RepID=A0A238KBN4_9RHOB|nr:TIGR03862 family flavoprotein [Maliponia aquimaris]SMX40231.1 HI0933-like protein [Maliponia aquimaris]